MDELAMLVRSGQELWRTIVEEGALLVGDIPMEIRSSS